MLYFSVFRIISSSALPPPSTRITESKDFLEKGPRVNLMSVEAIKAHSD